MKQLAIGNQDFKSIRDSDKYYVDKSMLIAQILDCNDTGAYQYTRPRRFGKSLNLSMIDAFFNIKYRGNKWFDGLEISKHRQYDKYRNSFPVVTIDLRCEDGTDYSFFIDSLNQKFSVISDSLGFMSSSEDESEREFYKKMHSCKLSESECRFALYNITRALFNRYGKKAIILIDEYDNPMNNFYGNESFEDVRNFLRVMLSTALKGNQYLQFAVVTGVMQIAKESIFSGLNNLKVNNILSEQSDEMFGFTDDEVKKMCADYGQPEKYGECRGWYDGYRFGNADIYNPWSVLNYVEGKFKPDTYWAGTSGNDIISTLIGTADAATRENLLKLSCNESVEVTIRPAITIDEMARDPNGIYSVMAMSGYLTVVTDDRGCQSVRIPNRELLSVFGSTMMNEAGFDDNVAKSFSEATLACDTVLMGEILENAFKSSVSGRCLRDEGDYQLFVAGLLMHLSCRYRVTADFESGEGYHDVRLISKQPGPAHIVMEFKKAKKGKTPEATARSAIEQIMEKDYAHGLKGKVVLFGIAFGGKTPIVVSETIERR